MKKVLQMFALVALLAIPWATQAQTGPSCTPSPTSVDNSGVTNVRFGTGIETVNSNITWTTSPYYQNLSSQIGAVPAGGTCDMSIVFATGYTYNTIIWVDWNGDNTFSGTEVVYVGEASNTNPTTLNVSFDIPATQDTGTYLMRICAADSYFDAYSTVTAAANANPCASYSYGVGIDFTLRVLPPASCLRVQAISATDILSDGMTIHWVDTLNTSTTYTLSYWTASGDTTEIPGLTGNSYVLTNLDDATLYYVSILPDCNDGTVSPRSDSFMTDCENGSCDLTFNCTDEYGDGWNGNYINVMQNGGLMGSVTIASGSSYTGTVHVCGGVPVTLTFTQGSYSSEMGGTVVDGGGNTVFVIENMGNVSNQSTLTTIAVPCPACSAPTALTDSIDENGDFILSWTSSASAFMVYAGDSLYDDNVTDNSYTFTGLSSSSIYQLGVAALCDNGDTSGIARHQVITPCGTISSMPWSYGFENDANSSTPMCWTILKSSEVYSEGYPTVQSGSYSGAHTGSGLLVFNAIYDDDTNLIVTSPITYNPGNLYVSFWFMGSMNGGSFDAGLLTDTNDITTFRIMKHVTASSADYVPYEYVKYEFFTDTLGLDEGDTAWLAFRLVGTANAGYNYDQVGIDDVNMRTIPNCRMPLSGSGMVDSISHESAYFSWDGTSENGYDLMLVHYNYDTLGNVTDTVVSHVFSNETSITVDTLVSNTVYFASVATICDIDGEADTTEYLDLGQFQTQLRCYPVYQARLNSVSASAANVSWSYRNMGIVGTGAILTLTDLTNTAVAPVTMTVTTDNAYTFNGLVSGHTYSVTFKSLCGDEDTGSVVTVYFTTHLPECARAFTDAQATNISSNSPAYPYYDYSFSQTIYSDSVLSGIDTLTGIAYNAYFSDANYIGVNNITMDVYLRYVDSSELTTYGNDLYLNSSFPIDTNMIKVVDNYHVSVTGNGWVYIPFNTPFQLQSPNPAKRLMVTTVNTVESIENNSNGWTAMYDYTYNSSTWDYFYKSRYAYSAYNPVNPASPGGYGNSYVPDIKFYGNCALSCAAPTVAVSNITGTSANIQVFANGSESSWTVDYRLVGDTVWTTLGTTTTGTIALTGLTGGSGYEVRAGAICTDTVVYSSPVSFYTSCEDIMPPYTVTFTSSNPCWDIQGSISTNGVNIYGTYGYHMTSPVMGVPLDTLMLTITDRCYGTGSVNQQYKVSACDPNGGNKVQLATVMATEGSNFGTHIIYLLNYTGTQHNFILEPDGGDVYIKQITVDYLPSCLPVFNLTLDTATANSLTLSWTSVTPTTSFTVKYRQAGTTAWSTANTTTSNIVLTGLASSSTYEVQVVSTCTDGSTMSTDIMPFNTACVIINVPYNVPVFGTSLPACWQTYSTGHPNATWEQSLTYNYGYIYSYASSSSTPVNDWLMTPVIAIPATAAADSVMLVYQTAGMADSYYSTSIARYELLVATNGGTTAADFTDTLIIDTLNSSNFSYRRFPMANYAGNNIRIAFHSTCANYGQVGLYDIGVRSILVPMYYISGDANAFTSQPSVYKAIRVEGETTSTAFSWTSTMATASQATMTGANTDSLSINYLTAGVDTLTLIVTNTYGADTSRVVVHVHQCDIINSFPWTEDFEDTTVFACWNQEGPSQWTIGTGDHSSSTGAHGGSYNAMITHSTTGNVTTLITPVFNLSGASTATLSYWYVMRKWVNDLDELHIYYRTSSGSNWTLLKADTTEAATWTFDTITLPNTSATYQLAFEYTDNYGYGVGIDDITITGVGGNCIAPIITSTSTEETTATVRFSSTSNDVEVGIVPGNSWTVPTNTTVVSNDSLYTFTGLTGETVYTIGVRAVCGNNQYSEWANTTVTTQRHPCHVTSTPVVSNQTYDGATVSWQPGENETAWEVNVFCESPVFDTIISANNNSVDIHGLDNGVTYNVAVRAMCSTNWYSEWSDTVNLTTSTCPQVTGVAAENVSGSSATITWTSTGAASYEVEYGNKGFQQGAGTLRTTATNSIELTGLEAESSYDVFVRSICAEGAASLWSVKYTFTTLENDGIDDIESSRVTLYPNPASTSVTLRGLEGECTVTVVDLNGREVYKTNANNTLTIDLSGYAKGAYFVRITGESTTAIRKLIVK